MFATGAAAPFVFDDRSAIVDNTTIRQLWPPEYLFRGPADTAAAGRPVVGLTLAINYAIGRDDPRGYHRFNIALHACTGLLLFGLIRQTCLTSRLKSWEGNATGFAFATTLLWLVHPLQVDAVTYVVQRTELLASFFYLATLYAARRAWNSPIQVRWQTLSVVCCVLGMGSKEIMVSAPLAVLLYDYTFAPEPWREWWRRRRRFYIGLFASWCVLAGWMATSPRGMTTGFGHGVGAWDYSRQQCVAILRYLRLAAWPVGLCMDYGESLEYSTAELVVGATAIGVLVGLTLRAVWRRDAFGFLGGCFFMVLAPTSSFVPIVTEVAAERRMYLPLAAVLSVVLASTRLVLDRAFPRSAADPRRRRWRSALVALGVVVLSCACAVRTVYRNRLFCDPIAIWRDAATQHPKNARAHHGLGDALRRAGRPAEALSAYETAIGLRPDYADAYLSRGVALRELHRDAEAEAEFRRALECQPDHLDAQIKLGSLLADLGRFAEAEQWLRGVLTQQADQPDVRFNLGVALVRQLKFLAAREQFALAGRALPGFGDGYLVLAEELAAAGQAAEARHYRAEAVRAFIVVADDLAAGRQWTAAASLYARALDVDPGSVEARAGLSRAVAADGK